MQPFSSAPSARRRPGLVVGTVGGAAALLLAAFLSGCGGSSQSTVSSGFQSGAAESATYSGINGGSVTLSTSGSSAPVTFATPSAVASPPDLNTAGTTLGTQGTLTYVPNTAYQFQANQTFPTPLTITIAYNGLPTGEPAPSLGIYYLSGTTWMPALPASGGFTVNAATSTSGTASTTVSTIQGSGLYAVFSLAPTQPSVPPLTTLSLVAPATATHGKPFTVSVNVLNGSVPETNYAGTITGSSTDSTATFSPSSFTFTNGVTSATFTITLNATGSQTVTFKDNSTPPLTTSATLTVQ